MDERSLRRFMRKVEILPNGCWRWTGRPNDGGYGTFSWGGKRYRAHRASYEHFVEPIPDGLEPDHTCHTRDAACPGGPTCPHRACVNWEHMELVTHRINVLRGRARSAVTARATHCPHGHPYDEANTYYPRSGGRQCRACNKRRNQERRARMPKKRPRQRPPACPQGHPYVGDNIAYRKNGTIRCRQCYRDRASAYAAKKRTLTVPSPPKTHCLNGHEYTPENTYSQRGVRRCRECNRERCRRWRRKKAAS